MTKSWKSAVAILLLAIPVSAGTYTRPGGCLPVDSEIDRDCTARNAEETKCENEHDVRTAVADMALAATTAKCATDCIAAAAATHRVAVRSSRRIRDRCLGRLRPCIYTCEEAESLPPCCPGIEDEVDCIAFGGMWDYGRDCCYGH